MNDSVRRAIAQAFERQIAEHAVYRHEVKLIMETGVGPAGGLLGEAESWATGVPLVYAADIGQQHHPRLRHEGLQTGDKAGRATISARAAETTVDALGQLLSRYRRVNATTRYRPQVLVDGQAVQLENVVTDPIAEVVVLEYVQPHGGA